MNFAIDCHPTGPPRASQTDADPSGGLAAKNFFSADDWPKPLKRLESPGKSNEIQSPFSWIFLAPLCLAWLTLAGFGFGSGFGEEPRLPRTLRPHLPVPSDPVFERAQLLDADRPARVHAPRRDADLRPETKLAAVGELG